MKEKEKKGNEATRNKIITATLKCLVRNGYGNTSTVDVCKEADIGRGTLLYYYNTKYDLICAAIEHALQKLEEDLREIAPKEGDKPDVTDERMQALFKKLSSNELAIWIEIIIASRTDKELNKHVVKLMKERDLHLADIANSIFPGASEPFLYLILPLLAGVSVSTIFKSKKDLEKQRQVLQQVASQLVALYSVDDGKSFAEMVQAFFPK